MGLQVFLIIISIVILTTIIIMSFVGFTTFDAIAFCNYEQSSTVMNKEIESYIQENTENRILVQGTQGEYFLKTVKVHYDIQTDIISFNDKHIPLSSKEKLMFLFLPYLA